MAASSKKIVLITGGNTGIGYETVKALVQSETAYHILLGSRSVQNGDDAIATLKAEFPNSSSTIETVQVDVASDESIQKAFEAVKGSHDRIDALINNAGASFDTGLLKGTMTHREVWNKAYDVNVSGTQVMTHTFVPLLLKSSDPRLLFVTSGLASLQRASAEWYPEPAPPPAGWPKPPSFDSIAYRSSKTGLNMMMLYWAQQLRQDGVKVWSISPGFLATGLAGKENVEMLRKRGAGDPSLGGIFIRKVVEGERDSDVGKVVNSEGVQPF